jgi:putative two-component system hydrogenase maturation factor HypX/HoxX
MAIALNGKEVCRMRILLLTESFNGLTQRLYGELAMRGHDISIEFDIADAVSEEAVALFRPDLIIAPFLKRAIPESIWSQCCCLIVHPGPAGNRGPSALDWAVQQGAAQWGVTVLQAEAEMDAGPIWASATFQMRSARKSSIYRHEVTEAAVQAVLAAVDRKTEKSFRPERVPGAAHAPMKQANRAIDWRRENSAAILAKLNAADGYPGVADTLFGQACHLFDAWPEADLKGVAGALLGRRETAICRATVDGAVWIGHIKAAGGIKLPSTVALPAAAELPELPLADCWKTQVPTWQDISYEEIEWNGQSVGFLTFEFYNGAMSTRQCQRLTEAFLWAMGRPTRVIVLRGGSDFWSNGINLNMIEAAESPADESWANINAIDDLAEAILRCSTQLTVSAVAGNAGAGGCFLARAADFVWVREGVILNPHYKNMGNLFGSEFWTYLLPPRVGEDGAREIMRHRLPMTVAESVGAGFYDDCLPASSFAADIARRAAELASAPDFSEKLAAKQARRQADEAIKPLAAYRAEELTEMRRNFYGFDPSYHVARYHFVSRSAHSWTPRHLARHRDIDWKVPE